MYGHDTNLDDIINKMEEKKSWNLQTLHRNDILSSREYPSHLNRCFDCFGSRVPKEK